MCPFSLESFPGREILVFCEIVQKIRSCQERFGRSPQNVLFFMEMVKLDSPRKYLFLQYEMAAELICMFFFLVQWSSWTRYKKNSGRDAWREILESIELILFP